MKELIIPHYNRIIEKYEELLKLIEDCVNSVGELSNEQIRELTADPDVQVLISRIEELQEKINLV